MTAEPRPAVALGPTPPRVESAVRASRTTRSIGVLREQAHLPAEQPPTGEDPRFPSADADARWSRHPGRPPQQGSLRAVRLRPSTCCRHVTVCAPRQTSRRRCVALGAADRADVSSSSTPTGPTRGRINRRGSVLSSPRPWAGRWPVPGRSASCATSSLSASRVYRPGGTSSCAPIPQRPARPAPRSALSSTGCWRVPSGDGHEPPLGGAFVAADPRPTAHLAAQGVSVPHLPTHATDLPVLPQLFGLRRHRPRTSRSAEGVVVGRSSVAALSPVEPRGRRPRSAEVRGRDPHSDTTSTAGQPPALIGPPMSSPSRRLLHPTQGRPCTTSS